MRLLRNSWFGTLIFSTALSLLGGAEASAESKKFRQWVLNCDEDFVTGERSCSLATVDDSERKGAVIVGMIPEMDLFGVMISPEGTQIADLPSKAFLRVDDNPLITVTEKSVL